jgi:hypothetical protein
MEIKRTQPGPANWNRTSETAPAGQPPEASDADLGGAGGSAAFDAIRADFRRADLGTTRWNAILTRSIDALLDSAAGHMGGLPAGAREKLSTMLAADPLFHKRVMTYWDQNLN